ncbi:MAG: hypothetical protein QXL01_00020 [Thermoplasmatales archaeon]
MAINYTNSFDISIDLLIYSSIRTGSQLTLGLLRPIAVNRYFWLAENWSVFYVIFKAAAAGDTILESALENLDRAIQGTKLGNKNNELENNAAYQTFFPLLNLINISDISLTPNEIILKDQEIDRVRKMEIDDFRNMLSFLKKTGALYSEQIGLGDSIAAKYRGTSVTPKRKNATIKDLVALDGNCEAIKLIEGIIFDLQMTQRNEPNLLQISNNNIELPSAVRFLDIYRSFITAPFEISLEHMAKKYLGSQDLWYELVTINKLKPPFVDESGEKFNLLAPAAINNCIIADSRKHDIPVGVSVGIGSFRFREEVRVIERVIENEDGTVVLFLSGKPDLNKFTTEHNAYVRIYSPGTTRTNQYIKIPLTSESPLLAKLGTPRDNELRRLDRALLNFGVDIARDEKTNDILLDSNGNFKKAYGLDNVRQAVLFALRTVRGELPFHPGFGVNLQIGDSFFGTTDEALLFGELIRGTLLRDSRFLDVQILNLATTGTSISLSLLVFIAGSSQPIPLSFVS